MENLHKSWKNAVKLDEDLFKQASQSYYYHQALPFPEVGWSLVISKVHNISRGPEYFGILLDVGKVYIVVT